MKDLEASQTQQKGHEMLFQKERKKTGKLKDQAIRNFHVHLHKKRTRLHSSHLAQEAKKRSRVGKKGKNTSRPTAQTRTHKHTERKRKREKAPGPSLRSNESKRKKKDKKEKRGLTSPGG